MSDVISRAIMAVGVGVDHKPTRAAREPVVPVGPRREAAPNRAQNVRIVSRSFEGTNLRTQFESADNSLSRPHIPPSRKQAKRLLRLVMNGAGQETIRAKAPAWSDNIIFNAVLAEHGAKAIEANYDRTVAALSTRPKSVGGPALPLPLPPTENSGAEARIGAASPPLGDGRSVTRAQGFGGVRIESAGAFETETGVKAAPAPKASRLRDMPGPQKRPDGEVARHGQSQMRGKETIPLVLVAPAGFESDDDLEGFEALPALASTASDFHGTSADMCAKVQTNGLAADDSVIRLLSHESSMQRLECFAIGAAAAAGDSSSHLLDLSPVSLRDGTRDFDIERSVAAAAAAFESSNNSIDLAVAVAAMGKTCPAVEPFPAPSFMGKPSPSPSTSPSSRPAQVKVGVINIARPEAVQEALNTEDADALTERQAAWIPDRFGLSPRQLPGQPIMQLPLRGVNVLRSDDSPLELQIGAMLGSPRHVPLSPYRAPDMAQVIKLYSPMRKDSSTMTASPIKAASSPPPMVFDAGHMQTAIRPKTTEASISRNSGGSSSGGHGPVRPPERAYSARQQRNWNKITGAHASSISTPEGTRLPYEQLPAPNANVEPVASPTADSRPLSSSPASGLGLGRLKLQGEAPKAPSEPKPPWRPSSASAVVASMSNRTHVKSAPPAAPSVQPAAEDEAVLAPRPPATSVPSAARSKSAPANRKRGVSASALAPVPSETIAGDGANGLSRVHAQVLARLAKRKIAHRQQDNQAGIAAPIIGTNLAIGYEDPEGLAIFVSTPPELSYQPEDDWIASDLLLDALDGDDDLVPLELTLLFKTVSTPEPSRMQRNFFDALALLEKIHTDLACPQRIHEAFWLAHCEVSAGNLVSIVLRLSVLNKARNVLMSLLRTFFGRAVQSDLDTGLRPGAAPRGRESPVAPPPAGAGIPQSSPRGSVALSDPEIVQVRNEARRALALNTRNDVRSSPDSQSRTVVKIGDDNSAHHPQHRASVTDTTFMVVVKDAHRAVSPGQSASSPKSTEKAARARGSSVTLTRRASAKIGALSNKTASNEMPLEKVAAFGLLKKFLATVPWKVEQFVYSGANLLVEFEGIKSRLEEMKLKAIAGAERK